MKEKTGIYSRGDAESAEGANAVDDFFGSGGLG